MASIRASRPSLTQRAGDANLKRVQVTLPLSLALDPDNAQALCEFEDGTKADPTCPKGSIVGRAVARTPLLDQPLTGAGVLRQERPHRPEVGPSDPHAADARDPAAWRERDQAEPQGHQQRVQQRPAREHVRGDSRRPGVQVRSDDQRRQERDPRHQRHICRRKQVANVQIDGQNNKSSDRNTPIATQCRKAKQNKGRQGDG